MPAHRHSDEAAGSPPVRRRLDILNMEACSLPVALGLERQLPAQLFCSIKSWANGKRKNAASRRNYSFKNLTQCQ